MLVLKISLTVVIFLLVLWVVFGPKENMPPGYYSSSMYFMMISFIILCLSGLAGMVWMLP